MITSNNDHQVEASNHQLYCECDHLMEASRITSFTVHESDYLVEASSITSYNVRVIT
jgi:hypothetical protein